MRGFLAALIVLIGSFAALTAVRAGEASATDVARVQVLFSAWDKPESPGAIVAVARSGKTIYRRAFGLANLTYGIPLTPETPVNAGSIAKHVTAVALLTLEAEDKLSLDDEIHKYLPELPDYGAPITIRNLLQQTSGLRDYRTLMFLAGWLPADVQTNRQALNLIFRQKALNFPTGTSFIYSNSNFVLGAEIVARVSGQSFGVWAHDHLFVPLGMTHTLIREDNTSIVPGLAASYSRTEAGKGFREDLLDSSVVGSGNLITTTGDLLIWADHLMTAKLNGVPLIDRLQDQAVLPGGIKAGYGLGVFVGSHRGLPIVHHGGETAGNRADLMLFPEQNVAIAMLANVSAIRTELAGRRLADIFLADDLSPPRTEPAKPPEPALPLAAYEGLYQLDMGALIEVGEADGRPYVIFAGTPPDPLISLGGHRFGTAEAGVVFRFTPVGQGRITGIVLEISGRKEMPGHRLPPVTLTKRELRRYIGTYFSDELETFYHVDLGPKGLVVQHKRLKDVHLAPIGDDRFLERPGGNILVQFHRRSGRARGFDLSVERARHIEFGRR